MNNILTQVKIDLYSSTSYEVIKAQQGDKNSRIIDFILYNQGEPYELSDNVFFRFVGHRGDGSSFSKTEAECITRNGNHVSVTLPEDVLSYDGIIEAKLVMYETSGKSERTVLSTIPFKISCIKNPCNENNLSDGELSIVTDLVFQMAEFSKNAQDVIDQAQVSATNAADSAKSAADSAKNAANSAITSTNKSKDAAASATNAKKSEDIAISKANAASTSAQNAATSATDADTYATKAQSYAVGGTNTRTGEEEDNAKHYSEQAQKALKKLEQAGAVTGIKGVAEADYRTGNVEISPDDIGAPYASYVNAHFVPDYVSTYSGTVDGKIGWHRIAQLEQRTAASKSCTITLERGYNSPAPEVQVVQLLKGYDKYRLVQLSAYSIFHMWTKIRVVMGSEKRAYLEVYQDRESLENVWRITIENALGIDDVTAQCWKAIPPELIQETMNGITQVAILNLADNIDFSYCIKSGHPIPAVGKDGYIAYPSDGRYYSTTGVVTGCIKISLPVSWTSTMIKFSVTIFDWKLGESFDYIISGYNNPQYTSSGGAVIQPWQKYSVVCIGKAGAECSNLPVRFGHDGSKCTVMIGHINTVWNYPHVLVHDILVSYHESSYDPWKSGWNILFETSLSSTVIATVQNTHVAYGGVAGSCNGNSASATKATQDGNGNVIANTYAKRTDVSWNFAANVANRGNSSRIATPSYQIRILAYNDDAEGNRSIKDTFDIPVDAFYRPTTVSKITRSLGNGDYFALEIHTGYIEIVNSCYAYDLAVFTR